MKRAFLPLLLALMLLTLPALSLARDYPAYAVVNNPNPQDRLHLREAPSADSASLGKYFNGVFAYVLLDDTARSHRPEPIARGLSARGSRNRIGL